MTNQSPNWFDHLINSVLKAKGPLCPEIFSCYTCGCGGGRDLRLLLFGAAENEIAENLGDKFSLEWFNFDRCMSADWFKSHGIFSSFSGPYIRREALQFSLINNLSQQSNEAWAEANENWDQMYAQGAIVTAPTRLEKVRTSLRERVAILFCEGLENSRYLKSTTDFDNRWPFNVGSRLIDHIYETFKKSHTKKYAHELMLPYSNLYQKLCRMERGSPWRPQTYRAA